MSQARPSEETPRDPREPSPQATPEHDQSRLDAAAFLGMERTTEPHRWRMPVTPAISSGMNALFGGCGLAAGVVALEETTGRPVVWATAQYLSFSSPPQVLDIEALEIVRGRSMSQGRAVIRHEGEEILTVNAALGSRASDVSDVWVAHPDVPGPLECPVRLRPPGAEGTLASRVEMRLANAIDYEDLPSVPSGTGRSALWVRIPEIDTSTETSAAKLSILGDYLPFGVVQAIGRRAGSTSLDNTIRMVQRYPTDWILADIRVHAVAGGMGTGTVFLWTDDRRLLSVASQTVTVRV